MLAIEKARVSLDQQPCSGRSLMRLVKARGPGWYRLTASMISDQMGYCGAGGVVRHPIISPRLAHRLNTCLKLSWLPWCSFPDCQSQAHYPEAMFVSVSLNAPLLKPTNRHVDAPEIHHYLKRIFLTLNFLTLKFVKIKEDKRSSRQKSTSSEFILSFQKNITISEEAVLRTTQWKLQMLQMQGSKRQMHQTYILIHNNKTLNSCMRFLPPGTHSQLSRQNSLRKASFFKTRAMKLKKKNQNRK